MKNISEVQDTIKTLSDQFTEVKKRYDNHAAFKIALQSNHSNFVSLPDIKRTRKCCPGRPIEELEISTFPFYHSADFARCLHVRCAYCGMAWIPEIDFDLAEYYRKDYAKNIQPFRIRQGGFHASGNPFFQSDTGKRMVNRAKKHLFLLNDNPEASLLELGPGPGICLGLSEAKNKFAYELDENSIPILRDELKVALIDIYSTDQWFDAILASHFLEHLLITDVEKLLSRIVEMLKPDGRFVVEVPYGADQIEHMKKGERKKVLFEPHTVSFSAFGLYQILRRSGLTVSKMSLDENFSRLPKDDQKQVLESVEVIQDSNLIAVCEKK